MRQLTMLAGWLLAMVCLGTAHAQEGWSEVARAPGELIWRHDAGAQVRLVRSSTPGDHEALCTHHGTRAEGIAGVLSAADRAGLCETLARGAVDLPPGRMGRHTPTLTWRQALARGGLPTPAVVRRDEVFAAPPVWPLRPSHLLVLGLLGALPWWWPRVRAAWAWGAVAAALRLLWPGPPVLMGVHYPFQRLTDATGLLEPSDAYGATWSAFMGALWWLSRGVVEVSLVNPVLSVLTVVLAVAWLWEEGEETLAHGVGLVAATQPLAVALAGTETMFVLASFLGILGVRGLCRDESVARWTGLVALVLLAGLRPLQLGVVVAGLVIGWRRGARTQALVGVLAVMWRVVVVLGFSGEAAGSEATQIAQMLDPSYVFGVGGSLLLSDPLKVPAALTALAVLGAAVAVRTRRPVGWMALLLLVVSTVPYLPFKRLTDVVRMGLPSLTWLAVLGVLGWTRLDRVGRVAALVALGVTGWFARAPLGPEATWVADMRLVQAMQQGLGPDDVVRYDDRWDGLGRFELWMNLHPGPTWVPRNRRPLVSGEHYWQSRADAWPDAPPMPCALEPVQVHRVPAVGLGVEDDSVGVVSLGWMRLSDCP